MAQQVVISFNANANFSDLIGEVRRANAEIATLQTQLNGLGSSAYGSLNNLNSQFIEGMRNSRLWSSTFVDVTNETREFGRHLDQGRLKLKDYFREFSTQVRGQRGMIRRLAEEQVRLQRSILTTTVGPQGQSRNILSTPTGLDRLDPSTMKALRAEQFKIIGRAVQGVSTELINLGKNTQWAGRQLTVGLTVPLTIFASQAAMAFKEVDQQLTRLAKVYGDIGGATTSEIASIKKETADLAKTLASSLGASATETIGLAADIAATGKTGADLLQSVTETTRLSVLGEVDRQAAMSATLSLQSAFNLNTKELAQSINFLNAVENQTSTSLADLVEAIPKAGPVVRQLGGDVKDLALFLTAMREGGINASEGANALKSGLASIINPTQKTRELMNGFGIDIQNIVNSNAGDLVGTVTALKDALNELNPLARAQAIEQIFGKFQFARMSALFDNLGKSGSQTVQVMKLMGASTADLAAIADRELTTLTESASGKFARQMETLKANMALAGEGFLGIFSKVLGGINKILDGFNKLPDGAQTALTIIGAIVGLAGPLIMLSGVFLNFIGYVVKSIGFLGRLFTGTKKFEMLDEQLVAVQLSGDKMASSLYDQAQAAKVAEGEINRLIESLKRLMEAQETVSSGAANSIKSGRIIPPAEYNERSKSGFAPTGTDFSHFIPRSAREALAKSLGLNESQILALSTTKTDKSGGISDVNTLRTLGTLGTYIDDPNASKLQEVMGTSMPSTIVKSGTSISEMRGMIGATPLGRDAMQKYGKSDDTIRQLFVTEEEYAKSSATHVANMKVINEAYRMSSKKGSEVANAIKEAWMRGGPEEAVAAAKSFATTLGVSYEEIVSTTNNEILAAFKSGGSQAGISAAAKAEVQSMDALIDQKIAGKLKEKTLFALTKMSSSIAQGAAVLDASQVDQIINESMGAELAGLSQKVNSKVEALRGATVRYVNGVATVFDAAGVAIVDQGSALKNPGVKAAIARLDREVEALKISAATIINETATAVDIANNSTQQPITAGPKGSIFRRMGGVLRGRAGLGSSMAMMGLGMGTTMLPTGGAGDIAGGAMMGASMGMMFGAPGAAVGAALGALVPAIKITIDHFKRLADIQALNIKQYRIDKEYAAAAGLALKTIGDIQLTQITGKSQEAASALEMLAKAALEASTATSTGALREKTKDAKTFKEVSGDFRSQYLSYIAAGASEETAKQMMAAILKAAGKEGFATDLKMMLSGLSGTTASQAVGLNMDQIKKGFVGNTQYGDLLGKASQFNMTAGTAKALSTQTGVDMSSFSNEQKKYINDLAEAYNKLTVAQKEEVLAGTATKQAIEAINNAMANQDAATFAKTMDDLSKSGGMTQEALNGVADSISGLSESEKTVLDGLIRNGVDAADAALALKMRIEGVIPSLQAVKDFDGMHIRAYFELYQANEALDKAKTELGTAIQGMYSGGTGPDTDAQKKAIQAQIDALEEIERKEKNINRLKELSIKYEEKRRALAVDYLSALSSGDLEGALRAQIQMQSELSAFTKEKAQAEKEIARENEKKALQDKLKALDSASGSVGKVANKAKEVETNVNNAIASVVAGFSKNGKMTVSFDEFIKSDAFANFEAKWNGTLSGEAMTKAMETLKASFKQLEASLAELAAGTTIGVGTSKSPRDITGYAQSLGIARAAGKDKVSTALSDPQRDVLIADFGTSGQAVDGEYVRIFGEKYQFKDGKLIRHKNAQGKWMGGQIKGYMNGGYISGFGSSVADNIPIMASNKEFMMNARAVSTYGLDNMERLNSRLVDPAVFNNNNTSQSSGGDVLVNINSINITEPGCTSDEIIAKIKKDLGAAVKRTTDSRYLAV